MLESISSLQELISNAEERLKSEHGGSDSHLEFQIEEWQIDQDNSASELSMLMEVEASVIEELNHERHS